MSIENLVLGVAIISDLHIVLLAKRSKTNMSKVIVQCWFGSKIEEDAIKRAGFVEKEIFGADPMDVIRKLYFTGEVSVAIMRFGSMMDGPVTIMVSDSWHFGQR
jgi:hypothetical protein